MTGPEGMEPAPDSFIPKADEVPNEFSRLRQRREQIGSEKTIDLPVPGYSGQLIARYQLLDWDPMRKIFAKMERTKGIGDRRELLAQIDTLVLSCQEILYVDGNGKPISFEGFDDPVRYDSKLAEILGFEAENARQVVLETFRNEIAISAHHQELIQWMQDASPEADEEFLGESKRPQQ